MNPNASEWKPSFSAPAWTPGQGFTAAPAPPPPPAPVAPPPPPAPVAPPPAAADNDSGLDEQDPLWQAVLKIAQGNRQVAMNMLQDPDQLAMYPEVAEALAASAGAMDEEEEWEQQQQQQVESSAATDTAASLATSMQEQMTMNEETTVEPAAPAKDVHVHPPAVDVDDDVDDAVIPTGEVDLSGGDPREHLNLVFIGHVDAGKSTLSGNILYLTDHVDKRTIERYEKEAKERNRESWFLAFIMDIDEAERAKGITVEVGKAHFATDVKRYTILDAPGHKNYVPNMIQGASQADVGILVISARKGEFEAGFEKGGQSREHAMLAKTLGVSYLVVAINKMDEPTVKWSKERFDECVNKLRPFLKSCGFTIKKEVRFLPISGLNGANVKEEVDPAVCTWWKKCYTTAENNTTAPTLFSLLDSLEIPNRDPKAPLRIPVVDRYSDRGTIVMGKVESGVVRPGMKITVMPTRTKFKVDEVWIDDETSVALARPGENVLVKLSGARTDDIRKGYVLCGDPPCRAVDKIICQIAVMDMPDSTKIMTAGFQCVFHAHAIEEDCTIIKVFETTNQRGQVVKDARFVTVNMRAIVMIQVGQTVPVEVFDQMQFLGRFTLRTEGKTVAIGKVTKLPPKKE